MRTFILALLLMAVPAIAYAGTATYSGNIIVPTGATLNVNGSAAGCALFAANGNLYSGICPTGTAGFSGTSPITITGTNPYAIGCPTCFTTAGGTITGATTFDAAVTVPSLSSSGNVTISGNNAVVVNGAGQFGSPGSGTTVQSVPCSVAGIGQYNVGWKLCMDTSGNVGILGQVTASQFNITSMRAAKTHIRPLHINGLALLQSTCWSSYHYKPMFGDPRPRHIGFIADCAPSILSGPAHDHFDIEAVSTVDAVAILQLERQVQILWWAVAALAVLFLALFVLVIGVARARR